MARKIIGVVLAAGASRRFGARDKLAARADGEAALVLRSAKTLRGLGLFKRAAITRTPQLPKELRGAGLDLLCIGAGRAQSASLHRAIRAAQASGASHLLIVLGDMPEVSRAHLRQLLKTPGHHPAMATSDGRLAPPALIPRRLFAAALRLTGDRGAGALLRRAPDLRRVPLPPGTLRDIDRPEDLRKAPH
ncbi:molybdenum cofactor cytidylyltransferase [Thioclava sp. ES.031]|nr:molybdenum cofactor cytidylyltransferase [Thioclava sp. ES.031]